MNAGNHKTVVLLDSRRLWSLWDMMRFYADRLFKALEALRTIEVVASANPAQVFGQDGPRGHTITQLDAMIAEFETLGLSVAAKKTKALRFSLEHKVGGDDHASVAAWVRTHMQSIREIMGYELEDRALFLVQSHVGLLEEDAKPPFGTGVAFMFSEATFDIAEAGKCLALRRYTACVFHLMRVVEIGIRCLADDLEITISPNAGWLTIINDKLEPAINALPEKTAEEKKRKKALQQARGHLHAIRLGWRNDTMHPKETYTEDEAEAIWGHVKTFMIHLSEQMEMPSAGKPS